MSDLLFCSVVHPVMLPQLDAKKGFFSHLSTLVGDHGGHIICYDVCLKLLSMNGTIVLFERVNYELFLEIKVTSSGGKIKAVWSKSSKHCEKQ